MINRLVRVAAVVILLAVAPIHARAETDSGFLYLQNLTNGQDGILILLPNMALRTKCELFQDRLHRTVVATMTITSRKPAKVLLGGLAWFKPRPGTWQFVLVAETPTLPRPMAASDIKVMTLDGREFIHMTATTWLLGSFPSYPCAVSAVIQTRQP